MTPQERRAAIEQLNAAYISSPLMQRLGPDQRLSENVEVRRQGDVYDRTLARRSVAENELRNFEPNDQYTPADIQAWLRRTEPRVLQDSAFGNPQVTPPLPENYTQTVTPMPDITRQLYPAEDDPLARAASAAMDAMRRRR